MAGAMASAARATISAVYLFFVSIIGMTVGPTATAPWTGLQPVRPKGLLWLPIVVHICFDVPLYYAAACRRTSAVGPSAR